MLCPFGAAHNPTVLLEELNGFPTMLPCSADGGVPVTTYDGQGARYVDDVGARQTVEPAIDSTANGILAFVLGAAVNR